jgi:uncharacterized protein YbjT (DUF2867 family)
MESTKPRVLVLGSTGLTGAAIAAELDDASDRLEVVRVSRDPATVEQWRREGGPRCSSTATTPGPSPRRWRGSTACSS